MKMSKVTKKNIERLRKDFVTNLILMRQISINLEMFQTYHTLNSAVEIVEYELAAKKGKKK